MKTILGLALILVAPLTQTASYPRPSDDPQPIAVQQNSPLAIQHDRGTDSSPFVVIQKRSADDIKAAREKAADDHQLTVSTENLAGWTRGLGIATIIAAIATMAAAVAAFWSSLQAKNAAKDLHKLERAYVFVRVVLVGFEGPNPNGKTTLNAKVVFHNHGKTPALLKILRQTVVWSDAYPKALPENQKANKEMPAGLVIGADRPWEWGIHEEITKEQLRDLRGIDQHAFVMGLLKYEDVMGNSHDVGFCWMSAPQKREGITFLIAPTDLNFYT